MSSVIKNDDVLEKYNEIWNKIKNMNVLDEISESESQLESDNELESKLECDSEQQFLYSLLPVLNRQMAASRMACLQTLIILLTLSKSIILLALGSRKIKVIVLLWARQSFYRLWTSYVASQMTAS